LSTEEEKQVDQVLLLSDIVMNPFLIDDNDNPRIPRDSKEV